MKKLLVTAAALVAIAVPATAVAAPGPTPADGRCVATGVKFLGGKTISAAARGQVLPGINAVPIVIKDHAFNNANVTEGLLGVTICA
jgi:hypothetical protein